MENNSSKTPFRWAYMAGMVIILALPLATVPPYFFPADFGKTIVFRSIIAIILCLFAFQFLFKGDRILLPNLKQNKIIWALLAFFGVFSVASLFGVDPYFSFWSWPIRSGGFVNLACFGILAILSFILFTKSDWKKTWDFSIVIGVLVSLVAIIQYYSLASNIFSPAPGRPSSTIGNPILLAIYLLLLFFLTLSFVIQEKRIFKKICYFVCLALFSYAILITGSRAAYLGILVGIVYFLLRYPLGGRFLNENTPKKILFLKVVVASMLVLVASVVFYVNTTTHYPAPLQNNKLFNSIATRLSIEDLLQDARFTAFGIAAKAVAARPILGYGPENFSVGFNKHYKATATDLAGIIAWWDRAHNIVIQTLSDAGILGLVAYLALFITTFWQLHKIKSDPQQSAIIGENPQLIAHGLQATLIAYLVANLFSFDSFSSYLIFFLLIGHTLHLSDAERLHLSDVRRLTKYRIPILGCLVVGVAVFLWQYNMVPLQVNAQINKAQQLAQQRNCSGAQTTMEKSVLPQKSFLDSYARLQYVDIIKTCSDFYPENNLIYKKRGLELIKEAVKIQPLYTRYWIFMALATTDLASAQKDESIKSGLIEEAYSYLDKAVALAPEHQEIPILQTKVAITAQDYEAAQKYAQNCIALNPDLNDCYFYLGLAQIYTNNTVEAQKNIQRTSKSYSVYSTEDLLQLSNAYGKILDYPNLVLVYESLVAKNPNVAQYHSSLAFFYQQVGRYKEARLQAIEVLRSSPDSKQNVEDFLKTLPYPHNAPIE